LRPAVRWGREYTVYPARFVLKAIYFGSGAILVRKHAGMIRLFTF
jgi:hypothetical protein